MHPFKKLIQAPIREPLPKNSVTEYMDFYGLNVPAVAHAMYPLEVSTAQEVEHRIMVQTFTPPEVRDVVLVCHGYYDHVGLYGHLIRYLLARGLLVVAFDQPGHGLATGQPAHIDSFDEYIAALSAVEEFAVHLLEGEAITHWVGQSMGGAILMEYFAQHSRQPAGDLVLLAPLVRPHAWWFNRWVFAAARLTIQAKKRILTRNADNPEFLAFLAQDPLQADLLPVSWVQAMVDWTNRFETYPPSSIAPKIVQGQLDRTIDWQYNLDRLGRLYPQAEWLMLPQARHHLVNESAALRDTIFNWLDERAFDKVAATG